ncbi:hypothetical protein EVAR_59627_1 [Eumeta japonica]|uniref:Uncharacterized protein n=1 Tax=Eumeta variegata TaxID=151549 RepID=A0A4C1YHG8_EUMVA|nr:hypothetical protein EVAR_59627_1 [Eumeta japonica]
MSITTLLLRNETSYAPNGNSISKICQISINNVARAVLLNKAVGSRRCFLRRTPAKRWAASPPARPSHNFRSSLHNAFRPSLRFRGRSERHVDAEQMRSQFTIVLVHGDCNFRRQVATRLKLGQTP